MFKINILKRITTRFRTYLKLISLIGIACALILAAIFLVYKPIYSVTLNGEFVGYIEDKTGLQKKINEYIKYGTDNNVAFVELEELPEYHFCLHKKDVETSDEEIFNMIKEKGTTYYRYYAVLLATEPKAYVPTYEDAEQIVEGLKNKGSANQEKLTYVEVHDTELKDFTTVDTAISDLYEKPVEKVVKKVTTAKVYTSQKISNEKKELGISFAKPISGTITSRFATKSRVRSGIHTGLDIAAPKGTPIKAAAGGTVTHAGWKGSLGNLVIVSHGNGIQTYYGHCSEICVSVGDKVSQGDIVAKVGSTGNSTGNHLHLEIRLNGVALNPQNYLY